MTCSSIYGSFLNPSRNRNLKIMKQSTKTIAAILVLGLILSSTFAAGAIFGSSTVVAQKSVGNANLQPDEFDVFWEAWQIVQQNFIDREALDDTDLTYGAIEGMIQSLGDEGHTTFLTPKELEYQMSSTAGTFSGIGAQLGVRSGLPMIIAPFDGSPADLAGIRAGDIILEVDSEDVTTWTLNEIVDVIRGPKGKEVVLLVLREGEEASMEIPIIRGDIRVPAASWSMIPGTDVALLRLSQFSANALEDVTTSIEEIHAADASTLIVDVRNNPGGLLEQAVRVTSQFLTRGNVLQEEDANGRQRPFRVIRGGTAQDIPLLVLINPGSASSAEIFAGAIQDHARGELIGETTFGTGTVLQPYTLEDGSALLLGTRQWLTANGRLIRKQGIAPDIEVDLLPGADLLSPRELKAMTLEELLASEDDQLLRALEVLEALPTASAAVTEERGREWRSREWGVEE